MAVYLYCRISQRKQSIERQKRNLKKAFPEGIIIEEAYSGTTIARPAWTRLYKKVSAGDTIVFDSVSRMSRNAEEGMEVYEELYKRDVNLVFLKEPLINTEVYREKMNRHIERYTGTTGSKATDKFVNAVIAALQEYSIDMAREQVGLAFEQSEKEVRDLHQRTREGLQTARLNGKHPGMKKGQKARESKKAKEAKLKIVELSRDFDGNNTDKEVRAIIGIARNTYYKYKGELRSAREAAAAAEVSRILTEP